MVGVGHGPFVEEHPAAEALVQRESTHAGDQPGEVQATLCVPHNAHLWAIDVHRAD